jgi:uncharacterized protein YjbJ (UPF0337 family)
MSGKTDVAKGRIKEAAGALSDNDKLRRDGKTEQTAGKAKTAVEKVVKNIKKAAEDSINKVRNAAK